MHSARRFDRWLRFATQHAFDPLGGLKQWFDRSDTVCRDNCLIVRVEFDESRRFELRKLSMQEFQVTTSIDPVRSEAASALMRGSKRTDPPVVSSNVVRTRRRAARREHALRGDRWGLSVHPADASGAHEGCRAPRHDRGRGGDPFDAHGRCRVRRQEGRSRSIAGTAVSARAGTAPDFA